MWALGADCWCARVSQHDCAWPVRLGNAGDWRDKLELPASTSLTPGPACRWGDTGLWAVLSLGSCYLLERAWESQRLGEMRRMVALGRNEPQMGGLDPARAANLQGPLEEACLGLGH